MASGYDNARRHHGGTSCYTCQSVHATWSNASLFLIGDCCFTVVVVLYPLLAGCIHVFSSKKGRSTDDGKPFKDSRRHSRLLSYPYSHQYHYGPLAHNGILLRH